MDMSKQFKEALEKIAKEAEESKNLRMSNKACLLDDMLQESDFFKRGMEALYQEIDVIATKYNMIEEDFDCLNNALACVMALCCETFAKSKEICLIMG